MLCFIIIYVLVDCIMSIHGTYFKWIKATGLVLSQHLQYENVFPRVEGL